MSLHPQWPEESEFHVPSRTRRQLPHDLPNPGGREKSDSLRARIDKEYTPIVSYRPSFFAYPLSDENVRADRQEGD